jgi:DNA processing protein
MSAAFVQQSAVELGCEIDQLSDPNKWPDGSLSTESKAFLRAPDQALIDEALNWQKNNCRLLAISDEDYPVLLKQLHDAPLLLYVVGDVRHLSSPQIAIVGSRTPTIGGKENAAAFAKELAQQGWTITSGLALGIDACAHQGALESGGATIAVIGTGADRIYPAQNKQLAYQIAERGCLISELPLGSKPLKAHFPRRNRLIAALSQATLVVEAALSSGSLITAREALDMGREVMAIPGSIHNPLARGPHQLIRQGAKLVETANDVLEELGHSVSASTAPSMSSVELDSEQQQLLDAMGFDLVTPDQLVERTGNKPESVASMLLILELQGQVSAQFGGYLRKH